MCRNQPCELIQIRIHPGGIWIGIFPAWWGLLHTEAVSTVGHEIKPGHGREFESFFGSAMAPFPKATQTIGLFTTLGDETGINRQGHVGGLAAC